MRFHVMPSIEALPRPIALYRQSITDPSYHFRGADRPGSYCVFQYTLAGSGCFRYHDRAWDLPAGTGFLCDIQDPAYAYFLGPHRRWEFLFLQMASPALHAVVQGIVDHHGPVHSLPAERGVVARLVALHAHGGDGVMSTAAAKDLVDDVLRSILESAQRQEPHCNEHLSRALQFIQHHPSQPLDATVLARRVGVSREYLTRLFRRHMGKTPYAYIVQHRIEAAAHELRHGSEPVAAVAAACGFSSPEVLSRVFRRIMGTSPSHYREGRPHPGHRRSVRRL